jgi:putative zinc finger protein
VTPHENYQSLIPAYIARRLEGEELRRLEAHLGGCEGCREMVSSLRELVAGLHGGGEAIFEPHPEVSELRSFALGEATASREAVVRHLEVCASCELEARAWRARPQILPAARGGSASLRPGLLPAAALSAAAGVIVGGALALVLRTSPAGSPGGAARPAEMGEQGEEVAQIVLPASPLRGDGTARVYHLPASQKHFVVDFQPLLPEGPVSEGTFVFEAKRDGGETVWSREVSAARVREALQGPGLISFLLPTERFAPGRYLFSMVPRGAADDRRSYRIEVEIGPAE